MEQISHIKQVVDDRNFDRNFGVTSKEIPKTTVSATDNNLRRVGLRYTNPTCKTLRAEL